MHYVALEERPGHLSPGKWALTATTAGLMLLVLMGRFWDWEGKSQAEEALMPATAFEPSTSINEVLVKPSAPGPLQLLLVPPEWCSNSIFLYPSTEKQLPPDFAKDGTSQQAWVYGARVERSLGDMAFATNNAFDIVKGKLLTWPNAVFKEKLALADIKLKFNEGVNRRETVQVVFADGSVQRAYWYFQNKPFVPTVSDKSSLGPMPWKIAMLGCTGSTGTSAMKYLLFTGNTVRCLARRPAKLPLDLATHPLATVIEGDARDESKLAQVMEGMDALVVLLGPENADYEPEAAPKVKWAVKQTQGGEWGRNTICSVAQPAVNKVFNEKMPNAKMVVVTSFGCGSSANYIKNPVNKFLTRVVLKNAIADKRLQEEEIEANIKNYILVRPGGLLNSPGTEKWVASEELGGGQIARQDLAAFILQECLGSDKWNGKAVSVATKQY